MWAAYVEVQKSKILDNIMRVSKGISRNRRRDIHNFWVYDRGFGSGDARRGRQGDRNGYCRDVVTKAPPQSATNVGKDNVVVLETVLGNLLVGFLLRRENAGQERPLFLFRSRNRRCGQGTKTLSVENRGVFACKFL